MSAHITAGRCQFNMPVRTALFEAYLREKCGLALHLEHQLSKLEEDFQAWGVGCEAALELEQRLQRAG